MNVTGPSPRGVAASALEQRRPIAGQARRIYTRGSMRRAAMERAKSVVKRLERPLTAPPDNLGNIPSPGPSREQDMAVRRIDLLQGTLDLLILRSLGTGPNHGYGIASRIHQLSDDVLKVEEGSLYPALYRMEEQGLVE